MEVGTLVELAGESDPESFEMASELMEKSLESANELLKLYDEAIQTVEQNPVLDVYERTLGALLGKVKAFDRLPFKAVEFPLENGDVNGDGERDISDAIYFLLWKFRGGPEPRAIPCPANTELLDFRSVLEAQRRDFEILRDMTEDVVTEFDSVLEFVRNGKPFFRALVSGELPFEKKFEELVRARSTFSHFYVQSCTVTILAAKSVYPRGFEFLDNL